MFYLFVFVLSVRAGLNNGAFNGCTSLEKVYYGGTESDWERIIYGSEYNESLLNAARYYYSENAPTAEQWESHAYWWHFDDETGEVVEWVKP